MKHLKNIILDLDNTLISSITIRRYETLKQSKKYSERFSHFKKHFLEDKPDEYGEINGFVIFERPGLQKFLTFLFKNFRVAVWSAGNKEYVDFIIKNIIYKGKKERKLAFKMYDTDCDKSMERYGDLKNLNYVYNKMKGYSEENTLLIDDLIETKNANKDNCYRIPHFEILRKKSKHDAELEDVKKFLKRIKK